MTLESSDQNGAKKCQIWKVLHFHLKNSDKIRKNMDGGVDVGVVFTWSVRTSEYGN